MLDFGDPVHCFEYQEEGGLCCLIVDLNPRRTGIPLFQG